MESMCNFQRLIKVIRLQMSLEPVFWTGATQSKHLVMLLNNKTWIQKKKKKNVWWNINWWYGCKFERTLTLFSIGRRWGGCWIEIDPLMLSSKVATLTF
jgi:hypothetical protein